MTLVPKREYILLFAGDIAIFIASLWITLYLRYLEVPSHVVLYEHFAAFSALFALWIWIFFLSGLYGKQTRLFRRHVPMTIVYAQTINVVLTALFFFFVPIFGLAPKTILLLYLVVSCALIFIWRVVVVPRMRGTNKRLHGVLIASGADASTLADEIANDGRYHFSFKHVIDTDRAPSHEVIQQACRVAEEGGITFVVIDFNDTVIGAALPIMYDAAFHKQRFSLVDVVELYQEVFDKAPLSLINYKWILAHVGTSFGYDIVKRWFDVVGALFVGAFSILLFPFIMLAIKLDDGGVIFVTQERVGRYQKPIRIFKFRSMTGNDMGQYSMGGKTKLHVTRVGKWLRILRLDELPQLWNVLLGDLSLVGPRPELVPLVAQYSSRISHYSARHLIPPGLMGWAQLKHDRHPHHGANVSETKEKLSYDLYYLKHRSILMDLYIILQTVRIIVTARGT